jgi:shikimate kinase
MGSGKTTIGNLLANDLRYDFVDLDAQIVAQTGLEITEIFKRYGESYFRELETGVLLEANTLHNTIIATGGGIISREANRCCLKRHSTFYLKWPFDTLYQRIFQDQQRPLVKNYQQLENLYKSRKPFYEGTAQYIVNCENHTIQDIIKYCEEKIKHAENSSD